MSGFDIGGREVALFLEGKEHDPDRLRAELAVLLKMLNRLSGGLQEMSHAFQARASDQGHGDEEHAWERHLAAGYSAGIAEAHEAINHLYNEALEIGGVGRG